MIKLKVWTKNKKALWAISVLFVAASLLFLFFSIFTTYFNKKNNLIFSAMTPGKEVVLNGEFRNEVLFSDALNPQDFPGIIAKEIAGANYSVEVAVYSLNSPEISLALSEAAERGVEVTVVLSDKQKNGHDKVFANLSKKIKRVDVGRLSGDETASMHHKFLIIDRHSLRASLISGSYNFTKLQDKYDSTYLLKSNNQDLIKEFGAEFDRLKTKISGIKKETDKNYCPFALRINHSGVYTELWWAPESKGISPKERLLELVNSANKSIEVMIWYFSDQDLATAIVKKAQQGVEVKVIADNYNFDNENSAMPLIIQERDRLGLKNISVITDAKSEKIVKNRDKMPDTSFNLFLHHHTLIVDSKIIAFGTNNWTYLGYAQNDEMMMVTEEPEIVSAFVNYFKSCYKNNY